MDMGARMGHLPILNEGSAKSLESVGQVSGQTAALPNVSPQASIKKRAGLLAPSKAKQSSQPISSRENSRHLTLTRSRPQRRPTTSMHQANVLTAAALCHRK
jgi:hypothetical protein